MKEFFLKKCKEERFLKRTESNVAFSFRCYHKTEGAGQENRPPAAQQT